MLAKKTDPSMLAPLCGEEEFAAELAVMVADDAPRLFAVVQELGLRVDARVAAWGMAFDDHAEVVAVDRSARMSLRSPEGAVRLFARGPHISACVVWVNLDAVGRSGPGR